MINYWLSSDNIRASIYIPKYYDPELKAEIAALGSTHRLVSIEKLVRDSVISLSTGDEIGKSSYGTGHIPFIRTSDFSNWELRTVPKQGISKAIYELYSEKQDVQPGDIFLVRDGTYLIGTNCIITSIDNELLYQSHILKIRVNKPEVLAPELFFLSLNSEVVQRQIRSIQFTADIIDTIGQRFLEVVLPIPLSEAKQQSLITRAKKAIHQRMVGKAFIKQAPFLIERVLLENTKEPIDEFLAYPDDILAKKVSALTITSELGQFQAQWHSSEKIRKNIFLPKYYDPSVITELGELSNTCDVISLSKLVKDRKLNYYTGVEVGKMAYGTGDIPFIRTSDFTNWEIKHDPKQGVSQSIYDEYADSQDVKAGDLFLVRDGTYLVGSSCLVTKADEISLFCGGLFKLRVIREDPLDSFLLLGLLNSFIVKRQIRTKQFTRDVIDTLGNRLAEVYLPIPKDSATRGLISESVRNIVLSRIEAREDIRQLTKEIVAAS